MVMKKTEARAVLRASETMAQIGIIASRGKKARSEKQKAATMKNFVKMVKAKGQKVKGSRKRRRRTNIFGF